MNNENTHIEEIKITTSLTKETLGYDDNVDVDFCASVENLIHLMQNAVSESYSCECTVEHGNVENIIYRIYDSNGYYELPADDEILNIINAVWSEQKFWIMQ